MQTTTLFVLELLLRRWDKKHRLFAARKRHCERIQAQYTGPRHQQLRPPELDHAELSHSNFKRKSNGFRSPVVIRGMLRDTRAAQRWSMEYFAARVGQKQYPIIKDSSGLLSSNTPQWHREAGAEGPRDEVSTELELELGTLNDVLDSARHGGFKYVNNITSIFADCPQLIEDLELNRLLQVLPSGASTDGFDVLNMFIGGKGTGTGMHCAFAGNFFCNVVGRKRWQLMDPRYTAFLLPLPAKPFIYSEVYFDPADPERNAFTGQLPVYEVTLEPGDVLFNGPWWWHRVENLDGFTVGCAVRRMSLAPDYQNNALFSACSIEPLMFLLRTHFQVKMKMTGEPSLFRDMLLRELDKEILGALSKKNAAQISQPHRPTEPAAQHAR